MISDLWELHGLQGAVIGRAERGKVDEHVHLWMFLHGVRHVLIDWQKDLLMTPVKLLFVVSSDCRDMHC